MDRTTTARLLAQVIAYLACGKHDKATWAAQTLVDLFRQHGLQVQ